MSSAPPRPFLPARTGLRLRRLAGLVLAFVVLVPVAANAVPVEPFAGYEPQTKCSPDAKPGTVALSIWLMKQYPGSGSSGISRTCGASGVSEHKEGRAFDWAVNVNSARDRGYVKDFFARIFATDAEGNKAALARRMGIMYLIWDDNIYASYRGFEKRDYTHSACKSPKSCSPTLRHRDHVHISLSRAGGAGDTSWYHRDDPSWVSPVPVSPTPTTPTPGPTTPPPSDGGTTTPIPVGPPVDGELRLTAKKQVARVAVPLDRSTWKSKWKLRKGKQYKITVAGLVGYGAPGQAGDGTCVWSPTTRSWLAGGTGVKVNGDLLFGRTCTGDHVYSTTYIPRKSKPLRVKLASATPATSGKLVLTVSKKDTDVTAKLPTYATLAAAPVAQPSTRGTINTLAETVQVPANGPATTTQEVEAGARYRLTVSGVVELGGGVQSDGQCLGIGGAWYQSASLDLRTPGDDHGNLYVNGYPFNGDSTTDCSTHSHAMEFTAAESRQLQLQLWDPLTTADNTGALTVTLQRLSALASPRSARGEAPLSSGYWTMARDTVAVNLASPDGTISNMRLRRGERVTLVVSGAFTSHGVTADATCVSTAAGWVPRDPTVALDQDPLELWIDGVARPWGACNDAHTYSTSYVVDKSGPLRLAVMDLDFRDNTGSLEVSLTRG